MTNSGYEDIINLPHYVSVTRPRMPISDRAAQFSPFSALTGYDAVISEASRLTDEKIDLDDEQKAIINKKLHIIQNAIKEKPNVIITYFKKDDKKDGGTYVTVNGAVKKIDKYNGSLILTDKNIVPICDIISVEGKIFDNEF